MNSDKIVDELEKFIKDYREKDRINTEEFCDSLTKTLISLAKILRKMKIEGISDEEIFQKFKNSYSRNEFRYADIRVLDYIEDFKHKEPFDVVQGMYYNKKEDKFELYPFRVINMDKENGKIELLGLKPLGKGNWVEVRDMEFKFIFNSHNNFIITTGEIPDKNRLVDIKRIRNFNYSDGAILIGLGGDAYWTSTPSGGSNAWYVTSNGLFDGDSKYFLYEILPYVVIEIEKGK